MGYISEQITVNERNNDINITNSVSTVVNSNFYML
jgi:hypothetical protein